MSENVVSIAPAVDWWALCPDGHHRRVAVWQLIHGVDQGVEDEDRDEYDAIQAIVPRYDGGIEGAAAPDDCHHVSELACVVEGACGGHDAAERVDEPVDIRGARIERAAS